MLETVVPPNDGLRNWVTSFVVEGAPIGNAVLGNCASSCPSTTVIIAWFDVIGAIPSAATVAVFGSSSRQVLKLPVTKSESVAVGLCDERVSARKLEKQPPRPSAVKSTPSSRNSPAAGPVFLLLSKNCHGTVIGEPFTIA